MILDLTSILASPQHHLMTQIRHCLANDRRATEKDANPAPALLVACKKLLHVLVVLAHDGREVRPAEAGRRDEARQWRIRVSGRAVLFQQEAKNVR